MKARGVRESCQSAKKVKGEEAGKERLHCAMINTFITFKRFVSYNIWDEARLQVLLVSRKYKLLFPFKNVGD